MLRIRREKTYCREEFRRPSKGHTVNLRVLRSALAMAAVL